MTNSLPDPSIAFSDPDILAGTPVFAGTRVPVQTLLDYLKAGDSVEEFLADFPTASRTQVMQFIRQLNLDQTHEANSI